MINEMIVFWSLMLLGIILRFFYLGHQSLWVDEAIVFSQINTENIVEVYHNVMRTEGHIGPVYHMATYLFARPLGYSEWSMRLFAALMGVLGMFMTWLLARRWFGPAVAAIALLLIAVAPVHIWYSQEARMYSLWIVLSVASIYFFDICLEDEKPVFRHWAIFAFIASAAVWTFLNSIFLFAAMGLSLISSGKYIKRHLLPFILAMLFAALCYFPGWMAFFSRDLSEMLSKISSHRAGSVFELLYAYWVFNVGTSFGTPLLEIRALLQELGTAGTVQVLITKYGAQLISAAVVMFLPVILALKKIMQHGNEVLVRILILIIAPVLLVFGVTIISSRLSFNVRYALCSYPVYVILLAYVFSLLEGKIKYTLLASFVFLSALSLMNYYFNPVYSKLDFKLVAGYLQNNISPGSVPLILSENSPVLLQYYDREGVFVPFCIPVRSCFRYSYDISNGSEHVYYIKTVRRQQFDQQEIAALETYLDREFKLRRVDRPAEYVEVYVYDRKS